MQPPGTVKPGGSNSYREDQKPTPRDPLACWCTRCGTRVACSHGSAARCGTRGYRGGTRGWYRGGWYPCTVPLLLPGAYWCPCPVCPWCSQLVSLVVSLEVLPSWCPGGVPGNSTPLHVASDLSATGKVSYAHLDLMAKRV